MRPTTPPEAISYIRKTFAPEDQLLQSIPEAVEARKLPMQIAADEGKLLQVLIAMNRVKTLVEFGTFAGYSAIWMARALPEDGKLYTIEQNPEHAALAQKHFDASDVGHKITLLEGKALDVLENIHEAVDMVFIDADKISYGLYLDWAEKQVKKGGLIVADNTFLFGAVYQDEVPEGIAPTTWKNMKMFNQRLADPEKYCGTLIPTIEGLTVAVKLF